MTAWIIYKYTRVLLSFIFSEKKNKRILLTKRRQLTGLWTVIIEVWYNNKRILQIYSSKRVWEHAFLRVFSLSFGPTEPYLLQT